MSGPNHPSSSKSKNASSRPNKSKKKSGFIQLGLQGYLIVADETIEISGPMVNELVSFFEQFSPEIQELGGELVEAESKNIHPLSSNFFPDVSPTQQLHSDYDNEQSQSKSTTSQTVININDNFKPVEDLKKETQIDDETSTEIGHRHEDKLNHNTLKVSANDSTINNDSPPIESISINSIGDEIKSERGESEDRGGSSLTIKNDDGQQHSDSFIPQLNPNKITILARPKQENNAEQKLVPRRVPQSPTYNTKTTSSTTANRPLSSSSNHRQNSSPLLPIPMPRELIEIANNYDAAQDGRSPNTQSKVQMKRKQFYLLQSKTFNMPKPQLKFARPVINDDSPFVPKLPFKPHAKVPLNLEPITDPKTGKIYYEHPYLVEIDECVAPPHMMTLTPYDWPLKRLRDTTYHLVQSYPSLQLMMRDLVQVPEIAFDVEHSDRSFFGLTCIIQLSTRFKDYIIDCFTLRDHLHCLNTVFTDPNILKVAHNATGDVINLQRDFGIYVVGLFDTSEAAKVLTASKRSVGLAALLSSYLNVETDKKYQLADWRIRPIPIDMVNYARTDTHYLLKLYDILKSQLISYSNGTLKMLRQCYKDSKDVCRLRYEKPPVDHWVSKFDERFSNQQKYALTELNKWRNCVARQEDDGVGHIASHKILSCLAEALPSNPQEMLNALRGTGKGRIPEFMERDMDHILKIFEIARCMPLLPKTKNFQPRRVVSDFLKTRVSNVHFFKAKTPNVTEVVYKIMNNDTITRPTFVQQILPVVSTCERDLDAISRELQKLLISYKDNTVFGIFNNFPVDKKTELVSCIRQAVEQVKSSWTFSETPVDFCIVVYGVEQLCCLSVVNGFLKFNGYKMFSPLFT